MAADCKSAAPCELRRFESSPVHHLVAGIEPLPDESCPYFPERRARFRTFFADQLPPALYHQLMDCGFRRSGTVFYQPVCRSCGDCIPIRVPVAGFRPSRTQNRIWRRNADLSVAVGKPALDEGKLELYQRYLREWHGRPGSSREQLEDFLYSSPVDTIEFTYREANGRLLAAGICDVSELSLSSVYFYFDPAEARRSLGTFGALAEIAFARSRAIPYYYLGFWIEDCGRMSYKAAFRPCELLQPDGQWINK